MTQGQLLCLSSSTCTTVLHSPGPALPSAAIAEVTHGMHRLHAPPEGRNELQQPHRKQYKRLDLCSCRFHGGPAPCATPA